MIRSSGCTMTLPAMLAVPVTIALSLIVYWRMRDTKRHSLILED